MKTEHKKNETKEVRNFLEKIVVNAGLGRLSQQSNFSAGILPQVMRDLSVIAGQKPQVTTAKKSIAGFKTRKGQVIGVRTTLRRRKMVDFFERLIKIVLPRVRDFRGLDLKSVDEGGVLNIGFREQLTFPEINPEDVQTIFPLGINLVPKEKNRAKALAEYRRLGIPLKNA